jgi:hypothetical protein
VSILPCHLPLHVWRSRYLRPEPCFALRQWPCECAHTSYSIHPWKQSGETRKSSWTDSSISSMSYKRLKVQIPKEGQGGCRNRRQRIPEMSVARRGCTRQKPHQKGGGTGRRVRVRNIFGCKFQIGPKRPAQHPGGVSPLNVC